MQFKKHLTAVRSNAIGFGPMYRRPGSIMSDLGNRSLSLVLAQPMSGTDTAKDELQTPAAGRSNRPGLLCRRTFIKSCTTGTPRQYVFDRAKPAAYRSIGLLADRFPAWRWRNNLTARDCGWMAQCAPSASLFIPICHGRACIAAIHRRRVARRNVERPGCADNRRSTCWPPSGSSSM